MEYTNTLSFSQRKAFSSEQLIYYISLTISIMSAVYLVMVSMTGYSWLPFLSIDNNSSDFTLSLIQCILGAAALHIPAAVAKLFRLKIHNALSICFYVFVLCATVLGEMFSLYYAIPAWDSLLHLGSGIMAGMLGNILVVQWLREKGYEKLISPVLVAAVAICFALCIGVVWEIYEFAGDTLLGLNMQKCLLQDGTELVGKAAIADTMKDLIVDMTGAAIAALYSALSLKKKASWLFSGRAIELANHMAQFDSAKEVLPYTA